MCVFMCMCMCVRMGIGMGLGLGLCLGLGLGLGLGLCMSMCMSMSMGMSMGMRMRVSKGKSSVIRHCSWLVNPLITLKFKSLLHSLSMCSHCMGKADSSKPCTPHPSRYWPSCHSSVASNTWTPFKAATIQKTQDGCSRSCISWQVMRVA